MTKKIYTLFFSFFCIVLCASLPVAYGDTVQDLKDKIESKNSEVKSIESEIAAYKAKLDATKGEKDSLNKAIRTLELNKSLILKDIDLTKIKINQTSETIEELSLNIDGLAKKIDKGNDALASSLRKMQEEDALSSDGLLTIVLSSFNISDLLDATEKINQFQKSMLFHIEEISKTKKDLELVHYEKEKQRTQLLSLNKELSGKKEIIDENKKEKESLLSLTRNKESAYQTTLKDRQAKKNKLEQELNEYEEQLRTEVDPTRLPKTGKGILSYPLAKPIITQYFGNTAFASANAQVYNGKGHNGIDFGTRIGTPLKASLSGIIQGLGNTDAACPGASYGKWVLIKHGNGLSTLYAHLSSIQVVTGQSVSTGEIIGLSGNTGYSTGPHLHFTVFASQGVEIITRPSRACGTSMTLPVAPQNAYLNPLSYL
jgi:murein DD-endopeptidase MepM/ murein hydrolase activator NlpD